MTDSLDDLLDRSSPALADRGRGHDSALAQMAADAHDTVRPPKRRRRTSLLTGIAAVALIGTAGVATANSDWVWIAGLELPENGVPSPTPTDGEMAANMDAKGGR